MKKIFLPIFVFSIIAMPAMSHASFFDSVKFDWKNLGAQAKVAVTAEVSKQAFVRGDKDTEILYIQGLLASKGYYDGKVSGLIGAKTQSAIRNWQLKNGLKATGALDRETTLSILGLSKVQSRGGATSVSIKMLLGGAYNPATGLMSTALNDANLIPIIEPYSELGYGFQNGGEEETTASVFDVIGPNAIVDWVIVEFRNDADMKDIEYSRAALLQADGDIVDVDGTSPLSVPLVGSYYVDVGHRNHLPVITETPHDISQIIDMTNTALFYDITLPGSAAKIVTGKQVLWPGDVNDDKHIIYTGEDNDRDPILVAIGGNIPTNVLTGQYRLEDVNMDGVVKYVGINNDRDIILQSVGGSTPTNTLMAQIPELYPIVVQLISTSSVLNDNGTQNADSATYDIRFKVTNQSDGDIVIPSTEGLENGVHTVNEGLEYLKISDSGQGANVLASVLTCVSGDCNPIAGNSGFRIQEGGISQFRLTVILQAQADGFFKPTLNSINWGPWNGGAMNANEFYTIDLGHALLGASPFSAPYLFLNAN